MQRFLAAILLLFAFLLPAAAQDPPVCTGRNLVDALQASDAKAYEKVMAEARATPNGEAILWKVEAKNVQPSWLMGTAHLTDPRITTLTPAARQALEGARVVALELAEATDQQRLAAAMMGQARLMVMPAGQSMWDLVPDAEEEAIRASPSYPGQLSGQFAVLQPWVLAAALSVPLCERHRQQAGVATLDMTIGSVALARNIPVEGLETIAQQLGVFAAMPLETQARYLISVGRASALIADYLETLVQLYQRRQITALMPLTKHVDPGAAKDLEVMSFFEQELIGKRNRTMRERAKKLIDGGNAFIAVGALHLPGEAGLVQLLRGAGYQVSPVE